MIRGYFLSRGGIRRPFVSARFQFPSLDNQILETRLLVDSGADSTVLAPRDSKRLMRQVGLEFSTLTATKPGAGVGGKVKMRTLEAIMTIPPYSIPLTLTLLEPEPGDISPLPSLLGRDILSHFALFMQERTGQLLLLEPEETRAAGVFERIPST